MDDPDTRAMSRERQQVFFEIGRERLVVWIVHVPLVERVADATDGAAHDLSVRHQWVDDPAVSIFHVRSASIGTRRLFWSFIVTAHGHPLSPRYGRAQLFGVVCCDEFEGSVRTRRLIYRCHD